MDIAALNTELTTDPSSIGYASLITAQNWVEIAALLNDAAGAGAATIAMPTMENQSFVIAFLPYLATALGSSKGAFYAILWQTILSLPVIDFSTASVSGLMAQAVADGILTTDQATALNQRMGARAEVLFGVGTTVSWQDVSRAVLGA